MFSCRVMNHEMRGRGLPSPALPQSDIVREAYRHVWKYPAPIDGPGNVDLLRTKR